MFRRFRYPFCMNRAPSPLESLGNAIAFVLVLGILAFGAYFVYGIITGENDVLSLGGTIEMRPTEVVVVTLPTLTPFAGTAIVTASSPTPLFQQPTAAPPTATITPRPTNTPLPTALPGTATTIASPTSSQPSPTSFPTVTAPPTETPVPTPIPATPTSPPPQFQFQIAGTGPDYSQGCGGYYIFGTVRDAAGNPLPGLRVRVVSEFGLEIPPATTKTDPPGGYDVLISQQRSLWYVQIVDPANTPLSPSVEVLNTGSFVDGSESCWHRVDFVRVN